MTLFRIGGRIFPTVVIPFTSSTHVMIDATSFILFHSTCYRGKGALAFPVIFNGMVNPSPSCIQPSPSFCHVTRSIRFLGRDTIFLHHATFDIRLLFRTLHGNGIVALLTICIRFTRDGFTLTMRVGRMCCWIDNVA